MFGPIARFELRYQLRNPVFWVATILFFLLAFGSMTVDDIQIGSGGNVHANAPIAIVMTQLILSTFFMFVTTAFVANAVVRDDESGFAGIVRSTRIAKRDYMLGRFTGAFIAAAIAFLAVPLALWLGTLMPWLDPETLGPTRFGAYLFGYAVLALPNIFVTSAIFFAVACRTRSMTYSYLGVVLFTILYFTLLAIARTRPELRDLVGYLDPFGARAVGSGVRYATAAESNAAPPPLTHLLIANRLIWIGIAAAVLGLAVWRFRFAERGLAGRRLARQQRRERKLAAVAPLTVARLPAATPARAGWARLMARTRFEMAQVFRSPAFWVLLFVGVLFVMITLIFVGRQYDVPIWPHTFAIIATVQGSFGLIPMIVAIYYSGEVVWRDRERRMQEIVDATSLPNWAYMAPKTLAVLGVLVALVAVPMIAAILFQLALGLTAIEPGQWLAWYLLPFAADLAILAVLAVFVQALSPNKFVGWAIMVVYLVATISLGAMGFEHPLYIYGASVPVPLSEMNGNEVGGATAWWLRLYWGAIATILAVIAHLMWRRGTAASLKGQWRALPGQLRGPAGGVLAAALMVAIGVGGFLFYNMNVLNPYRTGKDDQRAAADYERKYLRYEHLPQPTLTDVRYDVALYPSQRRMAVRGEYRFVNATPAPIATLHVRMLDRDNTRLGAVSIPGARLVSDDPVFQYRIYRFDRPLAPGQAGTLAFRAVRAQHGMRASGDDTRLVANGTFMQNVEFAPVIGMDRTGLLQGRALRRKYELPELRIAKLEDREAQRRNYIGADWVRSDITLSTEGDQMPVAPGVRVADRVANGRRTARFVSRVPILAFFSIQSARYAERSAPADGVRFSVFYDPHHGVNVDRMLRAMRTALGYYRANFGPYQFPYARVVEFPGYASYAQAFAGTIPYSEKMGFIMDVRDPSRIDYVTYVTAHEMAHQYWAHQLISAEMQGGTIMVETLAQYSALMVMKHLYGEDQIRRFLKFELDAYLGLRRGEATEELPLNRVENQAYIHYNKGSVVMYLLQDRLGEARVNRMLAGLLDRYRFKGAPYARSTDLVDGFLSLARTPEERQLVLDLLTRITLYDLKAKAATTRRLPDGRWETRLTVSAAKAYADGTGAEKPAPLSDTIDVGLFVAKPGTSAFDRADVLAMERRPVRTGEQVVRLVTRQEPRFAGIDPYNKYVDRTSDDNIVAVAGP